MEFGSAAFQWDLFFSEMNAFSSACLLWWLTFFLSWVTSLIFQSLWQPSPSPAPGSSLLPPTPHLHWDLATLLASVLATSRIPLFLPDVLVPLPPSDSAFSSSAFFNASIKCYLHLWTPAGCKLAHVFFSPNLLGFKYLGFFLFFPLSFLYMILVKYLLERLDLIISLLKSLQSVTLDNSGQTSYWSLQSPSPSLHIVKFLWVYPLTSLHSIPLQLFWLPWLRW